MYVYAYRYFAICLQVRLTNEFLSKEKKKGGGGNRDQKVI